MKMEVSLGFWFLYREILDLYLPYLFVFSFLRYAAENMDMMFGALIVTLNDELKIHSQVLEGFW